MKRLVVICCRLILKQIDEYLEVWLEMELVVILSGLHSEIFYELLVFEPTKNLHEEKRRICYL